MKDKVFVPKLFSIFRNELKKEQIFKDISAGIIVGIVALPLSIAFAIASGVTPEKGLITAIVAGFLISAFGGSRVQIGGPTGAFIVIVYAIVQEYGVDGLIISTFIAGFLLILMGLARLGNLLKFIPYPLIVGFTSGIAVIIFSSQIKDLFGLQIEQIPSDFLAKWQVYAQHFHKINWHSFGIALLTILISFNFHHVSKKIPGSLVAIILGAVVVQYFALPVETIETVFGTIPDRFTLPSIPKIDFSTIQDLIQPAFAIALLGGIESLLSAVVSDGMIGGKHRSNMELVAQGAANCFSAIFGGIPATGAIARTATNVKNGGRTPISGITHALTLLLIMLFFASYAKLIPMASLAGILVVVSYHMSEWKQFVALLKGQKQDILILLVTFFLTVIFDLVLAIEIGLVLSSLLLVKRVSESLQINHANKLFDNQNQNGDQIFEEEIPSLQKGIVLYEINGPLFFGAAQAFQDTFSRIQGKPKVLILRMRNVPFIDATGIYRLKSVIQGFQNDHVAVLISGMNQQIKEDVQKSKIHDILPPENILDNISLAIERANQLI